MESITVIQTRVITSGIPKMRSKKRMICRSLKSLKKLFKGGRSGTSCSTSKQSSSCTWTETEDSFDSEEDGYEDYEECSFLDFCDDELSSPPHIGRVTCHSEESFLRCRNTRSPGNDGGEISEPIEIETKQSIIIFEKNLILEIKSLIAKARTCYHHRLYQDALDQQLHILDLIHSTLCDNEFIDEQLRMQEATVEYEILKIKYVLLKECFTVDERRLAYDKAQNGKLNLVNKAVIFYQGELSRLSDGRKINVPKLGKVGYTLYLLHRLGKIHNKKLARYSLALDYYKKALELEIEVLAFLEARDEGVSEDHAREIQIW
eukprot:CAMPEP_0198253022 /NCGR_PEP_ID=MMETSP1447-20131203/3496_1 /TAXON_ID=420782 /ORGANISM="Chaetoceros dichaeta, Strain CCMP1751" /LENGTH=318 /DNA_ID=CAMNT_0043938509 /DNA_START=92 /DNA_END=1045 /DNA_ORIENTATION=-